MRILRMGFGACHRLPLRAAFPAQANSLVLCSGAAKVQRVRHPLYSLIWCFLLIEMMELFAQFMRTAISPKLMSVPTNSSLIFAISSWDKKFPLPLRIASLFLDPSWILSI
jgi:hypothetical protein